MIVLRAAHLGMCFGVRDAVALARDRAGAGPLTILGDLVHNAAVLADLDARGVAVATDPAAVTTPTVMITAHGASDRALARTRALGLQVVEATCPLVQVAHRAVKALVRDGCHPVIVGRRDHVEVRGLIEDLDAVDVVLTAEDVDALAPRRRFGVAAQTTQPLERVHAIAALIRRRFPEAEVRLADTVCRPTKQRQAAAIDLARRSDVVIVVGGAHSNNTRELVTTCRRHCARVHHVEDRDDLVAGWFAGAGTVGLTAGTSTPDAVIDDVERRLHDIAAAGERAPVPSPAAEAR